MMDEACFQRQFHNVHSKFQRLSELVPQFKASIDMQEFAAVSHSIEVLSRHNIEDVERRIDALAAGLSRVR